MAAQAQAKQKFSVKSGQGNQGRTSRMQIPSCSNILEVTEARLDVLIKEIKNYRSFINELYFCCKFRGALNRVLNFFVKVGAMEDHLAM